MYTGGACRDLVNGARVEVRFSRGSRDDGHNDTQHDDDDDRLTARSITFLR